MAHVCAKILMASSALFGTFLMTLPLCNTLYAKHVSGRFNANLVWRRVLLVEAIGTALIAPAVLYMLRGTSLPFKAITGK